MKDRYRDFMRGIVERGILEGATFDRLSQRQLELGSANLAEICDQTGLSAPQLVEIFDWLCAYQDQALKSSSLGAAFDKIVVDLYSDPRYPVSEHVSYALPHGITRAEHMTSHIREIIADSDPAQILDLGCGPGYLARRVLELGAGLQICGIDISCACVQYAAKLCLKYSHRSGFVQGDVRLESPEHRTIFKKADLILCSELLEHLPDPLVALSRWRRMSKPEANLLVGTPTNLPLAMHLVTFRDYQEIVDLVRASGWNVISMHFAPRNQHGSDKVIVRARN